MTTVYNNIRTDLPYARRFARAMCGNQESGDAYIMQALEALIADRSIFEQFDTPKIALYATFLKLWDSIAINIEDVEDTHSIDPDVGAADRNLQSLLPRSRQAFLLVSMEGFAPDEAAAILGTDLEETKKLIADASSEISDQIHTDVLIIEDEPLVAMDLEAAMKEIGHNVIGVATTRDEALDIVKQKQPGLVLADIQLADGSSGIDAVNDMLAAFSAPIVFITAFPERLLTGEKPEPAFLITKPFNPLVVKAITSQVLFFQQVANRKSSHAA